MLGSLGTIRLLVVASTVALTSSVHANAKGTPGHPSVSWSPFGPIAPPALKMGSLGGSAIALSASGTTLAIAAQDDGPGGSIWVYTLDPKARAWRQQGPKIAGTFQRHLGSAIAISGAGDTIVAATAGDDDSGVSVYTRRSGRWLLQEALRAPAGSQGFTTDAGGLAISGEGGTIAAAGSVHETPAIFVFALARSGPKKGRWCQQGPPLVKDHLLLYLTMYISLDFSGDVLAATASGSSTVPEPSVPVILVYTRRSHGTWALQQCLDTAGVPDLGYNIALSGNGRVIAAGSSEAAGVAVWELGASGRWARQGPLLTGKGATAGGGFGYSVALDHTGSVLAVGSAMYDEYNAVLHTPGEVVVFLRDEQWRWVVPGTALVGPRGSNLGMGMNVGVDASGTLVVAGCPGYNKWQGGAVLFQRR